MAFEVIFIYLLLIVVVFLAQKQAISNSLKNKLNGLSFRGRLVMIATISGSILVTPLFFLAYAFFWLFQKTLEKTLMVFYGDRFGGFLKNVDSSWHGDFPSKAIVMGALIVEFGGEPEEFFQKVKQRVARKFFSGQYPKLTSTRHSFLGYTFYLQNEVTLENSMFWYECQKNLDEPLMMEILSELISRPLQKNPNGIPFWDIFVANRPLLGWKNDSKKYLVVFRFHHSLCDGMGMHKILVGCFSDEEKTPPKSFEESPETPREIAQKYFDYFTTWCFIPLISTVTMFKKKEQSFRKIQITGEKVCFWGMEKEPKHLQMIAKIRKTKPDVFFTDLLLAAISKSFAKNVVEKLNIKADFVSFSVANTPYLAKFPKIHRNYKELLKLNNEHISCSAVETPISDQKKSCIQILEDIHERYTTIKHSLDSKVCYWSYRVMEVFFPNLTYDLPFLVARTQLILTNLPTTIPENLTVFGGCKLLEYSIIPSNYSTTMFTVCINSYEGRLQLALLADKCIVKNVDHGKKCVDDIYKYLDDLAEELGLKKH